jgi:hypothetical protein
LSHLFGLRLPAKRFTLLPIEFLHLIERTIEGTARLFLRGFAGV